MIKEYVENNKERFLNELFELIRIPSISSMSEHKDDMYKTADAVKASLLAAGVDKAEVMKTTGHPVVFAEKIIDPSLPTVLVYGHYDVQPVEPLNLWDSPPFEPEVRDGKIYSTIEIGTQCWMAQNLNIGTMILNGLDQSSNFIIEKATE